MSDAGDKPLPDSPPVPEDRNAGSTAGPIRPPAREMADDAAAAPSAPGPQPTVPRPASGGSTPESGTTRGQPQKRPRPHIPATAGRKLTGLVAEFAAGLKADPDLAPALKQNPLAFRSDLERLVRSQFRLKRGRRRDPRLDAACRMVKEQGRTVSEVLRLQIKDFEKLDTYTRYLAAKGLRQAVARRAGKTPKGHRKKRPRNPT